MRGHAGVHARACHGTSGKGILLACKKPLTDAHILGRRCKNALLRWSNTHICVYDNYVYLQEYTCASI